jgi:hypothetical protein
VGLTLGPGLVLARHEDGVDVGELEAGGGEEELDQLVAAAVHRLVKVFVHLQHEGLCPALEVNAKNFSLTL